MSLKQQISKLIIKNLEFQLSLIQLKLYIVVSHFSIDGFTTIINVLLILNIKRCVNLSSRVVLVILITLTN